MNNEVVASDPRKRIVYGHGNKEAKMMLIGEAPGQDEERKGRPFVGRSGELLEKMLNQVGILRSDVYITNVVKERPHKNNISPFLNLSKKVPIEGEHFDKYKQYLFDEIREINPNIIIAVGAVPLYTITGQQGITKWRGSLLESVIDRPDGVGKYKVIPIIHPAGALRQYIWRHFIAFDLKKAIKEQDDPSISYKPREYIVRPHYLECLEFLDTCRQHDRVAFDIEVSYGEVSCISFAYNADCAISIPFYEGGHEYFDVEQEYEIWKRIALILEDPDIESVGQNVTFDSTFLFRKYGIKSQNLHDTMIAQAIQYPDFPKGLDFITSIYTDMPYYKDEGKSLFKSKDVHNEQFWTYNAKDSIVLMEALPKMMSDLERSGNLETYEKQRRLIEPLLYMTEHGIRMDVDGLHNHSKQVEEELITLQEELDKIVGRELNPRSPKQLMEYFYGNKKDGGLGIPPYKNNGKPTTNEGALVRLARGTQNREPLREAGILLEMRGLGKLRGTYLEMSLDDDDRVRSAMNPVGAKTGRLSSSKTIFGTGANLQNQPPLMKQYMLSDHNHVAYEIDLGQAENRIVAYIAPEPKMIEAFENKIDIHSRTASYIFGIPEDEIAQMDKEKVKCESIGTGEYTHRFWGKKANHAFNYGQGYKAFAYQVEIPDHEGDMIHRQYHSAYGGVRKYHNWVKDKIGNTRTLENLLGRKYLFLDRWSYKLLEEAYAFIPQSTIADVINRWGLIHIYYNQDQYSPVKILNQIHDSIVFQIPLSTPIKEHAQIIKSISESLNQPLTFRGRTFRIPCDLKILPHNFKDGKEIANVQNMAVEDLAVAIKGEVYHG